MKHQEEEKEPNAERWTLTYLDMITLLFVLFVMLFAMSNVDAKKYQALVEQFGEAFHAGEGGSGNGQGTGVSANTSGQTSSASAQAIPVSEQFQDLYDRLQNAINQQGYEDQVSIEIYEKSIRFRFRDSILFMPDSDNMLESGYKALDIVAEALFQANDLIDAVKIEGHTAEDHPDDPQNLFAWELSVNRSIKVLEYFVSIKGLPQSKMTIAGYSHFKPVNSGTTEADKAANRRVEITVTRILDEYETASSSGLSEPGSNAEVSQP